MSEPPSDSQGNQPPCLAVASELLAGPREVGPRAILPLVRAARLEWADARPFLDADTPDLLRQLELRA